MNNRQVIDLEKASTSMKAGVIISEIQDVKQMLRTIYNKINNNQQSKEVNINIEKNVKDFAGLKVPSYIPDITPKQIYKLSKMGWSKEQICAISGYSPEEAQKKYDQHVRSNV